MVHQEQIATSILDYINYLQDVDYLATVVNSAPAEKLHTIIVELLQSEDTETVSLACLFIQDLMLYGVRRHPNCAKFVQEHSIDAIISTLEYLLFSPNHFIRYQAVHTLGKTCSYDSLAALNEAFNAFRDADPILLPRLLGEMGWLGAENFWALLDSMINSTVYMTRWAVVDVLSEFADNARSKLKCLEQLRQDSNALIQAEADYEYQLLNLRSNAHNLPPKDRRAQQKSLKQQWSPTIRFSGLSRRFTNHLYTTGRTDYIIGELEAFVSQTIATQKHERITS